MANIDTSVDIAEKVQNVKALFSDLINSNPPHDGNSGATDPLSASLVEDMLDRFKLWVGSLGATHRPKSKLSLEQRLARAPEVLLHIRELLSEMQESLQDAIEKIHGNPSHGEAPFDPQADEQDHITAQDLSGEILECIQSLFRIASIIKNASPRDRFTQALKATQYAFLDEFDINYVADKFPKLQATSAAWLRIRLGSAIAKRRQFIKYCYEHKRHLDAADDHMGAGDKESSKATTLDVEKLSGNRQGEDLDDDEVASVMTTTTVSDRSYAPSLPRLESISPNGEAFECPICCTLQTIRDDKLWKIHAFRDLKAYVCTRDKSEECGRLFFADRSSWFLHEMSHLSSHRCSICGAGPFHRKDNLQLHFRQVHGNLNNHVQLLADVGGDTPTSFRPQDCPFCDDWAVLLEQKASSLTSKQSRVSVNRFKRHVATHQEDLALFSLPRNMVLDIEDAASDSVSDEQFSENEAPSTAFTMPANPDEDWTKISDLAERKRIQNRIAQRNYRKKLKKRLEDLERRADASADAPKYDEVFPNTDKTPQIPPEDAAFFGYPDTESSKSPAHEGGEPPVEVQTLKSAEIPPGARWTKISRSIVDPEALTIGKESFEVNGDFTIVMRPLMKEEIEAYAETTNILRRQKYNANYH